MSAASVASVLHHSHHAGTAKLVLIGIAWHEEETGAGAIRPSADLQIMQEFQNVRLLEHWQCLRNLVNWMWIVITVEVMVVQRLTVTG